MFTGRRQRAKSPDKKQDVPFIPGLNPIFRPNGGQQAAPARSAATGGRGRVASTDEVGDGAALDRSGYADLGLGLVRQASVERLDDDGDLGARQHRAAPPPHDSATNRYNLVFCFKTAHNVRYDTIYFLHWKTDGQAASLI